MPFWTRSRPADDRPQNAVTRLQAAVRKHLPQADDDTVRIVASFAGLLAAVGYADQSFCQEEQRHVRKILGRIHGLDHLAVEALLDVLRAEAPEASAIHMHQLARDLRELTDRDTRLEMLDAFVDLAAADNDLSYAETRYLRQLTTSLGLDASDYNASQHRHRDKLSILR